jgi:hypothetical protein
VGCAVSTGFDDADPPFTVPATPDDQVVCDGQDAANFCDDCNPCTTDMNCTPCGSLPTAQRDVYRCTADDDLPPLCAGRTGCVHVAVTMPAGQSNDCYPVADESDPQAGVCRAGRCVGNPA